MSCAGTIQIDAHTTMISVSGVLFTLLGFGFAVGCTIRVGNLLGAQRPAQARLSGWASSSFCDQAVMLSVCTYLSCIRTYLNQEEAHADTSFLERQHSSQAVLTKQLVRTLQVNPRRWMLLSCHTFPSWISCRRLTGWLVFLLLAAAQAINIAAVLFWCPLF